MSSWVRVSEGCDCSSEHDEKEATGRSKQVSDRAGEFRLQCDGGRGGGARRPMGREAGGRGAAVAGSQRIASRFATCSEAARTDPSTDCGAGREEGKEARATLRFWSRGAGYAAVPSAEVGRSRLGRESTFSASRAVCGARQTSGELSAGRGDVMQTQSQIRGADSMWKCKPD